LPISAVRYCTLQGATVGGILAAYHMFLDSVGLAICRGKGDSAPVSHWRYPVRQVLRLQQLRHLWIVRLHAQKIPQLQNSMPPA
jgi:hypothetical protein